MTYLWPYAWMLFEELPHEETLVAEKWIPPSPELRSRWLDKIYPYLEETRLGLGEPSPQDIQKAAGGRQGYRSPHFDALMAEFREVSSLEPGAEW
jgi:1,2-phenylacetyl-CoA epoxidase catalytic subunit